MSKRHNSSQLVGIAGAPGSLGRQRAYEDIVPTRAGPRDAAPPAPGSVQYEAAQLEVAVDELAKELSVLQERVQNYLPSLESQPPVTAGAEDPEPRPGCQVAGQLRELRRRIQAGARGTHFLRTEFAG